jgi:integral membrane protein
VTKLFAAYRVLAILVGIFLLTASIDWVLHAINSDFPDLWWLWMLHGYIYIVYLVVAFVLTHRLGWSIPSFVLMLVAGLIPGLIFWVEHRTVQRIVAEHPELGRGARADAA